MISVFGVLCVLLVHRWMPATAHERIAMATGRGVDVPLDTRFVQWRQSRRLRGHGQPETTRLLQMLVGELMAGIVTQQAFVGVLGSRFDNPAQLLESPPNADDHIWHDVAAPRFAVLTLVLMPVLVWMTAGATGAQPIEFLTRTPIGWACIAVGFVLFALAIIWMQSLTRRALA